MMLTKAFTTSTSQDWMTPWPVFEAMKRRYPYDVDLGASVVSKKCEEYIGLDKGQNSLQEDWGQYGLFGWCNPPYGDKMAPVSAWATKALMHARKGFTTTLLLPLNKLDQPWFHDMAVNYAEVLICKGRIQFLDPITGKKGKTSNSQGSVFITFGPRIYSRFGSFDVKAYKAL